MAIEDFLDFVGIPLLRKRQREQNARLPGLQIVACYEAALM